MNWRETAHALLRIATGVFFVLHGGQKLLGWFGGFGGSPGATAPIASLMGVAGIFELVGGSLIALGLLTRPVAVVLAIEMAYAYVSVHLPRGIWPIENGGEPAALYCVLFLFFACHGAGVFSLDGAISRARHSSRREIHVRERPIPAAR